MDHPEPLRLLRRSDKWYLGGGNRLLYAPPFPLHRTAPGLWDTAHYYNFSVQPLFAWGLLDAQGREIAVRFRTADWQPDRWVRHFEARADGLRLKVVETSTVLPNDVAVSAVAITNRGRHRARVRLVAWTVREHRPDGAVWLDTVKLGDGVVSSGLHLRPEGRPEFTLGFAFGMAGAGISSGVQLSEGSALLPSWAHTPFAGRTGSRALDGTVRLGGVDPSGLVFAAHERPLSVGPGGTVEATVAFAAAPTADEARTSLGVVLKQRSPARLSTMSWKDHFDGVPSFTCSDPFLTTFYAYRWYGLRLNTIYGGDGNYEHPAVCEGIGYFRAPISYSAPCHMLENRWMHEPDLARGSLRTFLHNQRTDGGFRGYIDVNHYRQEMFYHANWGRAVTALEAVHPSGEFLREAYEGLRKYAGYFDRERDEEVSGLYDIDNHYETGQEYMHRYTAVDPQADRDNWGEVFRLKGVDVTVYIYELKQALSQLAEKLGRSAEADLWRMEAERTKRAMLDTMWDPRAQMFFDVDPATGRRTGVKAATCFYPYFTDIVDASHLAGLKRHLLDPKEFWTPWPVPSTSRDDPTFSAEPLWKGKRMNCPWNGRVWPMTNSHIMDALATSALRWDDRLLERKAGEFLLKFVRMMSFDRDPARPNCFEHYDPLTGTASEYRGVDDYMHSWVNDLIIRYVMGIQPGPHFVTVRPLRMGIEAATLGNVRVRGRRLDVSIRRDRFTVRIDGRRGVVAMLGESVALQI